MARERSSHILCAKSTNKSIEVGKNKRNVGYLMIDKGKSRTEKQDMREVCVWKKRFYRNEKTEN
jgi:hypothetical protein